MKNEITMYELLGLMKDGKAPKKIKYEDVVFAYDSEYKRYFDYEGISLFSKDYIIDIIDQLNNTLEILPEEKEWEDIEELDNIGFMTPEDGLNILKKLTNSLIKNQKKIIEKLEDKDDTEF